MKTYTLETARRALPYVRVIMKEALETFQRLERLAEVDHNERDGHEYSSALSSFSDVCADLARIGAEVVFCPMLARTTADGEGRQASTQVFVLFPVHFVTETDTGHLVYDAQKEEIYWWRHNLDPNAGLFRPVQDKLHPIETLPPCKPASEGIS
jgi:hypothetical protein